MGGDGDGVHPDQPGNVVIGERREKVGVESSQIDAVLGVDHHEVGAHGGRRVHQSRVPGHRPEPVDDLLLAEGVCT